MDFPGALQAWRQLLGDEHVLVDPSILAQVQTATFATTQQVPAILQPATSAEVQACVRIANHYNTPL
jgi:4-cresol dehydrogenase (hydroxylating)